MTLSSETLEPGSWADRLSSASSIPPSIPPPDHERSPEILAGRVLAKGRGIVAPESSVGIATGSLVRLVKRLFAVPAGMVVGIVLGTLLAPAWILAGGGRLRKVALVVCSPLSGLFFCTAIAWRYAARGRVDVVALLAKNLHQRAPIVTFPKRFTHHAMGLVVLTRHADVRTALERDDVFQVDIYNDRMRASSGAFFLGKDPGTDYDREQRLGATAFGRNEALIRECVGRLSRALVTGATLRSSRSLDVVSEFTHVVQLHFLKEYFGVRDTADERLFGWLETMSFFIFNFWIGGPYRAAAVRAGNEAGEHLRALVRERVADLAAKRPVTDDVLGRMVLLLSNGAGTAVDEDVAVRTMGGLISGGTIPATGTLISVVDKLLDLPQNLRRRLKEAAIGNDDAVVKRYVREAARFSAYPPTLYRRAVAPFEFAAGTDDLVGGAQIVEEGALVVTTPIFANYDADVFPNPEVFDPDRQATKETAPLLFGWARHRCLGEHVAELLMVEMVKSLFARDVERARGAAGQISNGTPGTIPDGDFPRRLIVRFGLE